VVSPGNFKDYLSTMEAILEKQLQEALAERRAVMGEFLRLKAELVRAQQRNDDLRSENKALREALHAAEHEVTNLFSYATQLGGAAS
jgi:predicted nuclease with TOPRIM domain